MFGAIYFTDWGLLMKKFRIILGASVLGLAATGLTAEVITMGPRPYYLIDQMEDGVLKNKLLACAEGPFTRSDFSIGHRGAQMQFPEHTVEANVAAARMGAGILECDVTFTKDKELVCRHSQNDLHTTTNILVSDIADTCATPFSPAEGDTPAAAECLTSDLTLDQFMTLTPKMDAADKTATSVEGYINGTAGWRTDLYAVEGTQLMTHAESINLFKSLGAKFTPELKSPSVEMPFDGFTQAAYAQKMIDEYKEAGIPPSDVWAQSFNLDDVLFWIENEPEFGAQAVFLDASYNIDGWSPAEPATWTHSMEELKAMGVNFIAPPLWVLVTLEDGKIVPSVYASAAKDAGIEIITWTLERSGPLVSGGGWYYQTLADVIDSDGKMFEVVDVLAQDVGVVGIFSDWPATTTYYASCMGMK
jgi:glycerophosphoryl diester phosphodiesterase